MYTKLNNKHSEKKTRQCKRNMDEAEMQQNTRTWKKRKIRTGVQARKYDGLWQNGDISWVARKDREYWIDMEY